MNALKISKLEKSVLPLLRRGKTDFFSLYGYNVWVFRFSDDNTRFEVNSPILWLITRKILGSSLSKDPIPMFYVVSDGIRTEHRGWELNTECTRLWPFFGRSYPRERKSYPWILFWIKIQLEMNFLRSDLSSSSTITEKIGVPVIMIHLLRLNQNRISVHFWRKKWRFW